MISTNVTVACVLSTIVLFSVHKIWRTAQTWQFLLKGRAMMLEHARQNRHKAYSLPIPGNQLHILSSKDHWHDINNASTSQLSPNAASREVHEILPRSVAALLSSKMFQPKYTFDFDWSAPREHVSLATVRSIRNITSKLPLFQGKFVEILDQEFRSAMIFSPQDERGWTRVALWPTVQRAVTRINTLLLFGEETANNEEFISRGLNFVSQTGQILESVRLVPSFLAPIVTKLIKGRGHDRRFVFTTLRGLIANREVYNMKTTESSRTKAETFLEGVVDYSLDDRTMQQLVDSINSTWVISTMAIPVVACQLLQDLYTHTEHSAALRKESDAIPLHESSRSHEISDFLAKSPLLEAFAMESWRTNCFQGNTAHRIAMKPFQFSDGYRVPAGEAIEFNQHSIMTDEALYPEPEKFDPSHFLGKDRSLVDTGLEWPFWGVPRYICPGRWHVANVEKLVAVYIMQNFDAKFESTKGLNFDWRDSLIPNPKITLLIKARVRE